MPGRPSSIGFGFQPAGQYPFGSADWAEEVTFKILPAFYRDDDATVDFSPPEPLRKYIDSIKPSIQEIRDRYEDFTKLWDANKVPIKQLKSLGANFDIALGSLQDTTDQTVTTVGSVAATVDLSTTPILTPAPINLGSVELTLDVSERALFVIKDDGKGAFPSSGALPSGATIDYSTGELTGITATLVAESQITASYISSVKDEALHRSEVLNAIQFFLNKGIDQGYVIAAAFSGISVIITPLWAETCDPGATLSATGPTVFFPRFSSFTADEIPTDLTFTSFLEKWPRALDWENPCRSSFLDLSFFADPLADDAFIDNFSALAEEVVTNLERVRPIHVRFRDITFEGPPAAGGGWTIPVVAESSASGGGWTIPVTGLLSVSSGWTIPVVATPTP